MSVLLIPFGGGLIFTLGWVWMSLGGTDWVMVDKHVESGDSGEIASYLCGTLIDALDLCFRFRGKIRGKGYGLKKI